jgi:putative flippase GtrA
MVFVAFLGPETPTSRTFTNGPRHRSSQSVSGWEERCSVDDRGRELKPTASDGKGNQAITAITNRYRVVRYFVIGGIAVVMDFVLFAILVKGFGLKWYYANVVSFTLIGFVHYALSIRFVFESGARFARHQELLLTFLTSLVGLLVNQLGLYLLVSLLGLEVLIAKIGAVGPTFFWNYLVRQNFIFRRQTRVG